MNISKRLWYYIIVIAFPLFFVLHGVNEQFGLIRLSTIASLLIRYFLVAVVIATVSWLLLKNYYRATVATFILLCIYFFFGVVKDEIAVPYKILLPVVVVLLVATYFCINKVKSTLVRGTRFIHFLLLIFLSIEAALLFYNIYTDKEKQKDLGDIDHKLIENVTIPDTVSKPTIVWIVMDEYSGNTALKKKWNFTNPLNETLRSKGFFVADSAWSPYNYTHYSLVSSLDMTYLPDLENHSIIRYRDIVRGNISLQETNVTKLLKSAGYNFHNYTIYNVDDHPTKAHEYFVDADLRLIDNQTLTGRIKQDIGWNLGSFISKKTVAEGIKAEAVYRESLIEESIAAARNAAADTTPSFLMFHYMLTHEPFIYKADGTLDTTTGFGMYPDRYITSINRANAAISRLIDSLQDIYKGKELSIVLQGDHGYKFDEADPLFEQEGCSILYAVYCSDQRYSGWESPFNSVNGFRVLFNKYFHTNLTLLENRFVNLYYR